MIEHAVPTESWLILLHGAPIRPPAHAKLIIDGKPCEHKHGTMRPQAHDRRMERCAIIAQYLADRPHQEFTAHELNASVSFGITRINQVLQHMRAAKLVSWRKHGRTYFYFTKQRQ